MSGDGGRGQARQGDGREKRRSTKQGAQAEGHRQRNTRDPSRGNQRRKSNSKTGSHEKHQRRLTQAGLGGRSVQWTLRVPSKASMGLAPFTRTQPTQRCDATRRTDTQRRQTTGHSPRAQGVENGQPHSEGQAHLDSTLGVRTFGAHPLHRPILQRSD